MGAMLGCLKGPDVCDAPDSVSKAAASSPVKRRADEADGEANDHSSPARGVDSAAEVEVAGPPSAKAGRHDVAASSPLQAADSSQPSASHSFTPASPPAPSGEPKRAELGPAPLASCRSSIPSVPSDPRPFSSIQSGGSGSITSTASGGRQHSLGRLQQGLPMDVISDTELTIQAGGLRHIGFGPLKKENQDEYFEQVGGFGGRKDGCCYCIFDGHGTHGGRVAAFCRRQLPQLLESELRAHFESQAHIGADINDRALVEGIVSRAFVETERLLQKSNVNCSSSGTTASVVFQDGNRVWVASAGDSRVVILQHAPAGDGGSSPGSGAVGWQPLPLTIDHRPIRSSERARVEAAGGRVEPKKLPSGRSVGEPRLWLQDIPTPGLMLSRSIGDDLATSIGCTAKPELVYMTLRPFVDHYLVMASDGVWDVLDNLTVCGLVSSSEVPQRCCDLVLQAALLEWEEKLAADNISLIVVRFAWGQSVIEDGRDGRDSMGVVSTAAERRDGGAAKAAPVAPAAVEPAPAVAPAAAVELATAAAPAASVELATAAAPSAVEPATAVAPATAVDPRRDGGASDGAAPLEAAEVVVDTL